MARLEDSFVHLRARSAYSLLEGAIKADATLERPSGWGPVSEKEWLGCVRRLVRDIRFTGVERAACS